MNIISDMKNIEKMTLEKEIIDTWSSLEVSYDSKYNTVYVHNSDFLKQVLKLKDKYDFNISEGIFAK
jgi:hypothetical protein